MITSTTHGPAASRRERALLLAAQRSDSRAEDELVRRYEPLVQTAVRRVTLPARVEREDLAQEARVAVLSAIRSWPDRAPFPALAERCVANRLIERLNYAGRNKHWILDLASSLNAHVVDGDGDARAPLRDRLASEASDVERNVIARAQLEAIIAGTAWLSARELAAIRGTLNDRSLKELALEQGTTAKAVGLSACRARRRLASDPIFAAPAPQRRLSSAPVSPPKKTREWCLFASPLHPDAARSGDPLLRTVLAHVVGVPRETAARWLPRLGAHRRSTRTRPAPVADVPCGLRRGDRVHRGRCGDTPLRLGVRRSRPYEVAGFAA